MSKLTEEQFEAYLKQIRELVEGPLEEMQPEIEVTNKFPQEFYDLAIKNDLYRFALPSQYGGWDLSELDILRVQEEFSRGPGGMRMHLHYAADLNWRILDDYGSDELKAQYMDKFQDKTVFTCFALTEQSGGTGADIHTTAEKDENGDYILNGEKWLISHTDCCEFAYVIAVTDPEKQGDERLSAFFVPCDTPGYETTPMPHMMGARGAAHTGLKFTNMKLDKKYLLGEETIPVPEHRRPWNNYIEIKGARENNLKGVDARFPLNVMTVVTGVSGSGKSTLVRDIFYRALKRELDECSERPGEFVSIEGDLRNLRNVEFVDQNPIGKSSRSNPVTYIKAYDEIRKLWADQPLAKQMGYTAGHFSFNNEGGRCEECKGDGTITVEMQFMADLVLECESCHGKRFKADTLEVKFQDKNIYDVLEMTVNQAIEFFTEHGQKKVVKKLIPLQDVGLGYIKLGQSSSTLSGGENQRVKLAYYLSQEKADPTLFIFDEPTTGLHFHDIRKLLDAFDALIRRGHSIVIIEHNMDVIKCADYVIDLGPEGGDKGGNIVATGTPEEVAACAASYTGQFLQEKLNHL